MAQGKKNGLGIFGRIMWLLNILVAVGILASYLSAYVDPSVTTIFSFFGLGYPFLFLLNAFFFLYWMIRRRRKLWLSLIVILIGYQHLVSHIQIMPGREAPEEGVISVMSFNVQNMVHSNLGITDDNVTSGIFKFLKSQQADIICIQEFADNSKMKSWGVDRLSETINKPYNFYSDYHPRKDDHIFGIVILSKYPAVDTNTLSVEGYRNKFGVYADLLIGGDTIRVYNLHLASVRLRHEDYKFVEDVTKGQAVQDDIKKGSSSILRKLHIAFEQRARETKVVMNSLANCPYPVIICGDFNDTPLSYAYHKISDGLDDAFMEAGHGLGNTHNGNLPPVRIDFILNSPAFKSYNFKVHDVNLSDHFPISVYLSNK